jgi:hypothetical protein
LGTPQLIFEAAQNKGISDLPSGTAGDANKLLKIRTLLSHFWHLNKSFEYKVSKIPLGVPKNLCVGKRGLRQGGRTADFKR